MIKLNEVEAVGLTEMETEMARRKYAAYFLLANAPEAKLYPHVKIICDAIQKIIDGQQQFLIIELGPQHGKSMAITETLPSYYLMRYPDKKVMVTAYGENLYSQFADSNRDKFTRLAPKLFGLTTSKNTANQFDVKNHKGEAFFTSMLGSATGHSADLLIIDDPIKNSEEAMSPTVKEKIWKEWTNTFSTRLQNNSSVIVIATRWTTDDLSGRLLQQKAYDWQEIKLPAIAAGIPKGQTDIIGRHNGEALCPELHTLDALLAQKKNLGTHAFNALYQQSPTIEGGNIFKRDWIKYYVPDRATMLRLKLTENDVKIMPRHLNETVTAWDATFKSKDNDDFVAGQTWSRRGAELYLRPGWCHKRLTFTQTLDAIRQQARMYPETGAKLVEDKANGPAILDVLQREIPGIVPVSPGADSKEARAASVSPNFEAGQIYVPHPLWHPEVEDLIEEWCGFPNMPHDDQVDSMVYAVRRLTAHKSQPIRSFRF